jgi:hypothetical protein
MMRRSITAAVLVSGAFFLTGLVLAQEETVGGLRISDEAGTSLSEVASPPGEKHFHLDAGVQSFYIAFDFSGTQPTEVEVRLLGPMGTILYGDVQTYDTPGTHVIQFDNGAPLDDNEYVVNAYVGSEHYLADSLQLAVGAAEIAPSMAEDTGDGPPSAAQATVVPIMAEEPAGSAPADTAAGVPGGPSRWMLLTAGVGVLLLLAVVVWAARSALRGS